MEWLRQLRFRLLGLLRKRKLEADMAEEMRAHLEFEAAARRGQGLSDEEARYAAQRAFGGMEQMKEHARAERSVLWLEQLSQDVRYAARSLARNPVFTLTIVLTLAVAMAGNATIFSAVNAVLLEPLPYRDIEGLVNLRETRPVAGGTGRRVPVPVSPGTFFDWRNEVRSFEQIAAGAPTEFTFKADSELTPIPGGQVSANFLPMLGVNPSIGRSFLPEENSPRAAKVALLSHGFWERRFGAAPSAVGQVITLDGQQHVVVGVLPAWFDGAAAAGVARGTRPDVWTPLTLVEAGALRAAPVFDVHARLKRGATLADAKVEVDAIMQRLAKEFPITNAARGAQLESLVDRVIGEVRSNLWMLFAAVGLVLLIACANVANLLLARATLRGPETAMRAALGASRSRLVRQFLTESLLLALAGCAVGLLLTFLCMESFTALFPASMPRVEAIAIDARVLWFTVAISVLAGVAFGLLPAWHGARTDLNSTVKQGGRSGHSITGTRARNALIVAQVALSLVLLVAAGLLLKSFVTLSRVDPGFDHRNVLTLRITLPGEKYRTVALQSAAFERLLGEAKALPGVNGAALVFPLPFSGPILNRPFSVAGRPADLAQELSTQFNIVTPEYFHALGIRMTQGRSFAAGDRSDTPLVAIVNETLARRIWPDESPIGKRIAIGMGRDVEREVVGVFADIKQRELNSEPLLQVCVPFAQQPFRTMYLAAHGNVPAATLLPAIRQRIAAFDSDLPHTDVAMWSERVSKSIAPRRSTLWLLAAFAGTALLLALVGLYGVMSYMVAQRTREFGIRMALGATLRDMMRLVVGQGMRLVGVGVALGVVASLGLTRVLSGLLFGVQPTDPTTFAAVSLLLALVGALACYAPARRAAKIDPMVALRSE